VNGECFGRKLVGGGILVNPLGRERERERGKRERKKNKKIKKKFKK